MVTDGGVVSTTMIAWLHVALVQASAACQLRVAVKVLPQPALVVVLRTVITTFVPLQPPAADGGSKPQAVPHSTKRLEAQVIVKGTALVTVSVATALVAAPKSLVTMTR